LVGSSLLEKESKFEKSRMSGQERSSRKGKRDLGVALLTGGGT